MGVASLELPDRGGPGYRCTIQLQPGIPSWMAHISLVLSLLTLHRGGPPLVFGCFLLLGLLLGEPRIACSYSVAHVLELI